MSTIVESIKELREKTGAGMMDCRKALETAGGDRERAVIILKEQGLLHARKRQDRETKEGRIFLQADARKAVLLHLACETDFVARNALFIGLGEECLAPAFEGSADEKSLSPRITEAVGAIKENIVLRGLKTLRANPDERIFTYVHGEGRIGVALALAVSHPGMWDNPETAGLAADIALHIAAFGPRYLSRESVDPLYLRQKEAEFLSDVRALGKPEGMIQGIVRGKMNKHLSQVCLMEQGFIREETTSVRDVLARLRSNGGLDTKISGFIYERVGG